MSDVCKCCGQTLPPKLDLGIKLTRGTLRIVELVHGAGEYGIRSDRLFDKLYADRPDGGPLTGMSTLHTRIHLLNRRLEKIGLRIKGEYTGHNEFGFYKLVRINEPGRAVLHGTSRSEGEDQAARPPAVP